MSGIEEKREVAASLLPAQEQNGAASTVEFGGHPEIDRTLSGENAKPLPREWREEFEAAARRPLGQRLHYAFIKTYKPVLDDEPYRAFDSMKEYRAWCEKELPMWLGFGR